MVLVVAAVGAKTTAEGAVKKEYEEAENLEENVEEEKEEENEKKEKEKEE